MSLQLWQATVLGLVEGITEYLPVSSTGHLILVSGLLGLGRDEQEKRAIDAFNIVVQGGAILAVVGLYWPSIVRMARGLLGRDSQGLGLFINLVAAFIPAAVLGKLLDETIEQHLFHPWPVLLAVLTGGLYMMVMDAWGHGRLSTPRPALREKTIYEVTPGQAFMIGLLQCVAMWPGTSRSMMTITGGMIAGLRPKQAAEFSFLLGLPTLTAATGYKLLKNVLHAHGQHEPNMFQQLGAVPVIVGIVVAALSAAGAIRWLVGFLNRHGLTPFGWYRVGLCFVLAALVFSGRVTIEPKPVPRDQTQKTVPPIKWETPSIEAR